MTLPLGLAETTIQLVPDGTILLHIVIILIMVFVLNRTLLKPINKILQARDERSRGRLSEAQQIMGNVGDKLSEYEHALREARGEAYSFNTKEHAAAMQDRQAKLDQMRRQIAESTNQEKSAIKSQADAARANLETESRRIAAEIGSRVLSRSVGGTDLN